MAGLRLRMMLVWGLLMGVVGGEVGAAPIVVQNQAANLRISNEVKVYQAVKDAVVNIASTRIINTPVGGNDIFENFWGPQIMRQVPTQSLGSGFVIHESGYIVTNEHVIDRATQVQVVLADGRKLDAKVLSTDSEHDVAVLKVNPGSDGLQAIKLGVTEDLMIGEPVYAIGNPYGYAGSMTRGIVSAVNRTLDFGQGKSYKGLVQTDASINPGNSGGPLLNAYGQVIGINSAIRGDAHGIGFAISASALRDLLPGLMNPQVMRKGVIGFSIEEKRSVTPLAAVESKLVVKRVVAGSEAAKVGLLVGDEILMAQGKSVEGNLVEMLVKMAELKEGDVLTLRVGRSGTVVGGQGKYFDVKIPVVKAPQSEVELTIASYLGITGRDVNEALSTQEKLYVDTGILITKVEKGGPAAEAGLRKGDVIYQVGQFYVSNTAELAALLRTGKPGLQVRVGVVRGESRGRTVLKLRGEGKE